MERQSLRVKRPSSSLRTVTSLCEPGLNVPSLPSLTGWSAPVSRYTDDTRSVASPGLLTLPQTQMGGACYGQRY